MTRVAIHGAGGRMGQRLICVGHADQEIAIVAAIDNASHPRLGDDAGIVAGIETIDVPIAAELKDDVDVLIDFSVHQAMDALVELCLDRKIPLVTASTGLSSSQQERIQSASESIPIVFAPSMSLSVNLAMKLAQMAAATYGSLEQSVDVEIIERHHRFKVDAPSGTALRFGDLIGEQLKLTDSQHGREGVTGERTRNEIGYHAVRTGDNPGEHTIVFGLLGETLELRVAASNRDCYASGAFAAAKFVRDKERGLFNMWDVLGLS